ncbi:MAG: IS256 family transposase [Bacteroidales bacterium]|nr:IS256 family transposase [Bacteroidales bacterium]
MNEKLKFTPGQVTKILEEIAKEDGGINKILKYSLEALMCAERLHHNEIKEDVSNGYRYRGIKSGNRQIKLEVPRSRYHQFYPVLLGVINDQNKELEELAFSLYGSGLTTEQVGKIFKKVYGKSYSTSQISRFFETARSDVSQWLSRTLESYYPIIYIDAVFILTRRGESVSKESYYTILGVKSDRTREVLAIVNFPTESSTSWSEVFKTLKNRGVNRIDLVISDALSGIEDAAAKNFSGIKHQLCTVHLKRNILKSIKPADKQEVAEILKDIFRTEDSSDTISKAWQRWIDFIEKYKKKYPFLKTKTEERYRLYFTYIQYDYRIRSMLYSTNWIERLNRDFRRTTRMRGALPNPDATILLLGYVSMNKDVYTRKIPKLNYEKKFDWEE